MRTYIYQADVFCEICIDEIKESLRDKKPAYPCDLSDENTYDSDDYPKGPYASDEADCPQHCGNCGMFLESPLTTDGNNYVKEALTEAPKPLTGHIKTWAEYYDYLTD